MVEQKSESAKSSAVKEDARFEEQVSEPRAFNMVSEIEPQEDDEFVELEKRSLEEDDEDQQRVPPVKAVQQSARYDSVISKKMSFERKFTINTAANAAAHRRSMITGKIRGLTDQRNTHGATHYNKDDLGFLFGGSAKPKLASH